MFAAVHSRGIVGKLTMCRDPRIDLGAGWLE